MKLSKDRQQRLHSIGFEWDPNGLAWMKIYNHLLSYKKQHNGSTSVPCRSIKYKKLANWLPYQRERYLKGELPQQQIHLLESIDFEWQVLENKWMAMYKRLVAYKHKYGVARVPLKWKGDPPLGRWVSTQCQNCKEKHRIDLLNDRVFLVCKLMLGSVARRCYVLFAWRNNSYYYERRGADSSYATLELFCFYRKRWVLNCVVKCSNGFFETNTSREIVLSSG